MWRVLNSSQHTLHKPKTRGRRIGVGIEGDKGREQIRRRLFNLHHFLTRHVVSFMLHQDTSWAQDPEEFTEALHGIGREDEGLHRVCPVEGA